MLTSSVEGKGPDTWIIRASRGYNKESAIGQVLIKAQARPNPSSSPYIMYAGARAWLELGNQLLAGGEATGATHCAQSGVAELGDDYAGDDVIDDTGLKIHAAEELIEEGRSIDGARLFLKMLQIRTDLYKKLHKNEVLE